MRFFTTFTIIMIAVLFIFLDIAKRNTAFLLYRVLLRVGLITFISIVGFFLFIVIVFIWRTPAPPLPEITYGEFPFRLEYELNEELHVIEDTLIVEFDGFGMNEGIGRYRRWTSRLASGEDLVLLLEVSDNKQIFYFPGPANYYMGDRLNGYNHTFPSASFNERERGIIRRDILHDKELLEQFGPLDQNTINEEELLNQYNIRLVNWEISEPIVNNFGD